jgi:hypothetical protein
MKVPIIRTGETASPIIRLKRDGCPYEESDGCHCWIPSTGILVSDLLSRDGEHPHDDWEHWPYCRR